MSIMKKILSSIGIGSATVDTKLENEKLRPGDEVRGVVSLQGGEVEQSIDAIYFFVMTNYIQKVEGEKETRQAVIGQYQLSDSFVLYSGEKKEIDFSFTLPMETPSTYKHTDVWVQTGLDIKQAFDPQDRDYVEIVPMELTDAFLKTLKDLGFRRKKVENEYRPSSVPGTMPFIQEFELVPEKGEFKGKLDELECIFAPQSKDELEVVMEIDRKPRGLGGMLSEALDMDESKIKIAVTSDQKNNLKEILRETIDRFSS